MSPTEPKPESTEPGPPALESIPEGMIAIGVGDGRGQLFVYGTSTATEVLQNKLIRLGQLENETQRLSTEVKRLQVAIKNLQRRKK